MPGVHGNPKKSNKLSLGSATPKTTDCSRTILRGLPSRVADKLIAASMKGAIAARPSSTLKLSGPCPQVLGELKNALFTTGKKICEPSGTETLRVTVPPNVPARNHTSPCCPTAP